MENLKNIVLIGLMGSGKTSIGKQLAHSLEKKFIDTDQVIELKTGVAISTIFELEGESGFRQRESILLEELLNQKNLIIATGGGVILKEHNRVILKKLGDVVYLRSSCDDLAKRLKNDKTRPLIQNVDLHSRLNELFGERDTLYQSVADYIIETKNKRILDIKKEILGLLK
jgi:shikimate kinase